MLGLKETDNKKRPRYDHSYRFTRIVIVISSFENVVVSVKATACCKCRRMLCYSKLSLQNVFNSWVRSVPLNTVISESL